MIIYLGTYDQWLCEIAEMIANHIYIENKQLPHQWLDKPYYGGYIDTYEQQEGKKVGN